MTRHLLTRMAPALVLAALAVTQSTALAAPPVRGAEITFSGFRLLPGGRSLIFVEMTDPAVVEVSRAGQVVEYKLLGATVPLRNNRNPLLLRDFNSSATSALLVREPLKKSVRLVITLRSAVTPTHRMVARGKSSVLEVELPASGGT